MALSISYIGNVDFRQNKPPAWDKNFAAETDTCKVQWQGAQYKEADFLDALTPFAQLSYIDEDGVTVTDSGMRLIKATSDDSPIFPTVSLAYEGCRGGGVPDAVITDDVTTQSASTTKTITDPTSPNYNKAITMSIQFYAARSSYEWAQLSDPAGVPAYDTVRYPKSYSGPFGDPNIFYQHFSGMVDAAGNPSNTISTADATAVWNSFVFQTVVSGFQSKEVVPGYVWKCSSTVDFLIIGS